MSHSQRKVREAARGAATAIAWPNSGPGALRLKAISPQPQQTAVRLPHFGGDGREGMTEVRLSLVGIACDRADENNAMVTGGITDPLACHDLRIKEYQRLVPAGSRVEYEVMVTPGAGTSMDHEVVTVWRVR